MLRAYFDTSVPSGIVDGQVPAEDVAALKAAFNRGELIAPIGPVILDELVGGFEKDRDAMIRKLKVLRDFGTFQGMLKQPEDILRGEIEAYANGRESPAMTLPEEERRSTVKVLSDVIAGSKRYDADLKQVLDIVGRLKNDWLGSRKEAQKLAQADEDWLRVRKTVTFRDYFDSTAARTATAAAKRFGRADSWQRQDLNGLLQIPAIRVFIGVWKGQRYSEVFGTQGQPRKPDRGDGYDLWHAVLASTAHVFVTFDERLADHVEQIPDLRTPRVARSIRGLLEAIEKTKR